MWTPICAAWNWVLAGWPKEYAPPLIALGGFALAFVTYRSSKKRDSFRLGIDLILRLGERFDSETMRARRANAAKALLSHPTKQDAAVNDVLDFFEEPVAAECAVCLSARDVTSFGWAKAIREFGRSDTRSRRSRCRTA